MSAAVLYLASDSDLPAPGDAELVERFVIARDQTAFAALVHRHSPVVLGVSRRVLYDTHDIDDVFQATFMVLVRDAARIRHRKSIASWLYGVAWRLSLRVSRQKQRRKETLLVDDKLIDDDTFQRFADRTERQLVDAELNALPERYRQPLVLRYLAGKSPREIATDLGITIGAVEGLLKRGKDELRVRLLQRGIWMGTALMAVQLTQQGVQAAAAPSLISGTIQASLAWNSGTNTLSANLVSNRVVALARKEIIVMTTATKTTIAAGLTFGGIIAGLGGASLLTGPDDGSAHAAGIVTTTSVVRAASDGLEHAAFSIEPAVGKPAPIAADETAPANTPAPEIADVQNFARQDGVKPPRQPWDYKSRSPNIVKLERALEGDTEVEFTDHPLNHSIEYLADLHHVDFWFDRTALSDAEIAMDKDVTLAIKGVALKTALRLILDPLQLDYLILNDTITITTRQKADEHFETRVYNTRRVPHLIPRELVDIITATVEPDSWNPVEPARANTAPTATGSTPAGNGTPSAFEDVGPALSSQGGGGGSMIDGALGSARSTSTSLIIRQTQRIHEQIAELLDQLEQQSSDVAQPSQPAPDNRPQGAALPGMKTTPPSRPGQALGLPTYQPGANQPSSSR
jgi:RNA polymerase sigma factor (sigma-70 family)